MRRLSRLLLGASLAAAASTSLPALANPWGGDQRHSWPYQAPYSDPYADPFGRGAPQYLQEDYRPQAVTPQREVVATNLRYRPGTIVISTSERQLYFMLGDGQAIRYAVGVGRPGFEWSGTMKVSRKREWPDWRPPAEMLARRPDLPRYMAGGPDNPLGARAIYLGSSLYRIHGTNEPWTIGQAVSSGCIRMMNEDVVDLYERSRVGTKVFVI